MDSSALLKRVLEERQTDSLLETFEDFVRLGYPILSSTLSRVEVTRTLRSRHEDQHPALIVELIEIALSSVIDCPMTQAVISLASRYGPNSLRSLDAIHLATAQIYDADAVVGYDRVMMRSASELGFRSMSPGAESITA